MEESESFSYIRARLATGNPAWMLLGIELRDLAPGRAHLALPFRPEVLNPFGSIHGGILTALADAAGGCAVYTVLPPRSRAASIELKVNFLRPVTADAFADARVLHCGSRTGVSYVEVRSGREIAAAALLTFALGADRGAPAGTGPDRTGQNSAEALEGSR